MAAAIVSNPPPAKSVPARTAFEVGAVVAGRYRIVSLLGEGSTGTVYAAEHALLHKKVAVKVLHPELTNVPDGIARFEREAIATARIEHQNVAGAIDFGRLDDGALYLALEFVDGVSLRQHIARGPLGVDRTLHIAQQIASALAAAQALDIVHRDLKPENVMLVTKGADNDFVKVLDFGVARVPVDAGNMGGPAALTRAGAVFGTAEYMSPEQGIGQTVDTRADLYALGVMMFEMLTGVRPYQETPEAGVLAQQMTRPIPTFASRAPGIELPPALERLVNQLLARHPLQRLQRADDACKAIEAIMAGNGSELPPSIPPAAVPEPLPAFELNTQIPGSSGLAALDVVAARPAPGDVAPHLLRASPNALPASTRAPEQGQGVRRLLAVVPLLAQLFRQLFAKVDGLVERGRNALPARLRERLARVATPRLSAAIIALLCTLVLAISLAVRHARTARALQAADAARAAASAAMAASAAAPASVEVPSAPTTIVLDVDSKDPDAMITSAQTKLRDGHDFEAVSIVGRVLGKHPDKRNDARVSAILFKTAGSTAKGASNTAFSLLQGVMAGAGAEVNYQLAIDKSLPTWVRARAAKWLSTPQFERASSDALRMAVKLRQASTCEIKHGLLNSAAKAGGAAVLAYLHELQVQTGCGLSGKDDCYPCLHADHQLSDAIAQIEARLKP